MGLKSRQVRWNIIDKRTHSESNRTPQITLNDSLNLQLIVGWGSIEPNRPVS